MAEQEMRKRILVIDDDPSLIKLVGARLTANGYDVLATNDAPSGLEKALKEKPDLIILDVMMPIVNGYNFCRLLKSQEGQKDIPVILLTSRADEKDKKIGEEVGANAYVTKPFNTEELLAIIKDMVK